MKLDDLQPSPPPPADKPELIGDILTEMAAIAKSPDFQEIKPPAMPFPEAEKPAAIRKAAYVVFDTETTGLFNYRLEDGSPAPADGEGQPRLASFAAILVDEVGDEISRYKTYIKPDGWSMPQGELPNGKPSAGMINGLTDEFLHENGIPVASVLSLWNGYVNCGLIPAAFNAQFDAKMMRAELRRAGLDDRFEETKQTCIMRAMKPYKEQGMVLNRGYVKLSVACEFFGIPLLDAHDAMADAVAAMGLLKILIRDGNVIPPKVHYAAGAKK